MRLTRCVCLVTVRCVVWSIVTFTLPSYRFICCSKAQRLNSPATELFFVKLFLAPLAPRFFWGVPDRVGCVFSVF